MSIWNAYACTLNHFNFVQKRVRGSGFSSDCDRALPNPANLTSTINKLAEASVTQDVMGEDSRSPSPDRRCEKGCVAGF